VCVPLMKMNLFSVVRLLNPSMVMVIPPFASALLNASTGFIIVFFTIFSIVLLVLGGRTLVNTLVAIFNACLKSMENWTLLHPFTLQLAL